MNIQNFVPSSPLEWVVIAPLMLAIFFLIFINWDFFEQPMEKFVSSKFEMFMTRFVVALGVGLFGGLLIYGLIKGLFWYIYFKLIGYF